MFVYVKESGFEIAIHEFPPFAIGSATASGLQNGANTANSMRVIARYKHFEIATLAPHLTAFNAVYKYCL